MKTNNSSSTITYEWAYSKVAYILDVEEVIFPMCDCVRRAGIWEPAELVDAVLSGSVKSWPKTTKRGIKQLFNVLRNQCNIDKATLAEAAKLYA